LGAWKNNSNWTEFMALVGWDKERVNATGRARAPEICRSGVRKSAGSGGGVSKKATSWYEEPGEGCEKQASSTRSLEGVRRSTGGAAASQG